MMLDGNAAVVACIAPAPASAPRTGGSGGIVSGTIASVGEGTTVVTLSGSDWH